MVGSVRGEEIQSICCNLMLNPPPVNPLNHIQNKMGLRKNPTSDTSCSSRYAYKIYPTLSQRRTAAASEILQHRRLPPSRETKGHILFFPEARSSQNSAAWRGEAVIALIAACVKMASATRKHPSLFSSQASSQTRG